MGPPPALGPALLERVLGALDARSLAAAEAACAEWRAAVRAAGLWRALAPRGAPGAAAGFAVCGDAEDPWKQAWVDR
jgi:hypothetical protein